MDSYVAAYATPEMQAYHNTAEFQTYLKAKQEWESAHEVYCGASASTKSGALASLNTATAEKDRTLELARKTAEHKVAFGW
jgi:hypothetical protein